MVPEEEDKIERFIWGLPDRIQGNVTLFAPTRFQDAVRMENSLMAQKVRTIAAKQADNKKVGESLERQPSRNGEARGRAYSLGGGGEANQDPNVVTGTFLLSNRYASMLSDTGADRSFVSTMFNSLIDIAPTALDTKYSVLLADGKIIGADTIIR
nr:putative reverse transcriptase domain-containing protein [Tanacetum cinerariifolium]